MTNLQQNVSQNQHLPFYVPIKKINELSLAIETLANSIHRDPPISNQIEQSEALSVFVVEGLLVGIQHLAQQITQLSQADLEPSREEEGI